MNGLNRGEVVHLWSLLLPSAESKSIQDACLCSPTPEPGKLSSSSDSLGTFFLFWLEHFLLVCGGRLAVLLLSFWNTAVEALTEHDAPSLLFETGKVSALQSNVGWLFWDITADLALDWNPPALDTSRSLSESESCNTFLFLPRLRMTGDSSSQSGLDLDDEPVSFLCGPHPFGTSQVDLPVIALK